MFLLNPTLAARSCADCQRYIYHDQGQKFGPRVERPKGTPVLRPKGTKTPCFWCPKIPPETKPCPENAEELSERNTAAYLHYLECAAIGEFPKDAIVHRNAALIRDVKDAGDRLERQRFGLTVLHTLRSGGG